MTTEVRGMTEGSKVGDEGEQGYESEQDVSSASEHDDNADEKQIASADVTALVNDPVPKHTELEDHNGPVDRYVRPWYMYLVIIQGADPTYWTPPR